jgi:hypothetical protein
MERSEAKSAIECLASWAVDKGYHVSFEKKGEDSICHISKQIEINNSMPNEIQFYRLLHECGHALIFENGGSIDYKSKDLDSPDNSDKRTYIVIEEIEAWKRGLTLAKRLKLPVDDKKWEAAMISAIKKYIKWAAKI